MCTHFWQKDILTLKNNVDLEVSIYLFSNLTIRVHKSVYQTFLEWF